MRRLTGVLLVVAAVLAAPALGHPVGGASSVTIAGSPTTIVFGSSTTISGQVTGKKAAGATVDLQGEPFPSQSFSTVSTTTADSTGHYSFKVSPGLNTIYRVMAKAAPTASSSNLPIKVRVKVSLGVSTSKPPVGKLVRFSGFVLPAYNGKNVLVQRKTAGGWKTIAQIRLAAATPAGPVARSKYSKRIRFRQSGSYRVFFNPADNARLANSSPAHRLT